MQETARPRPRPTGLPERVLAPDLARGVMLLFIAVANSHYFLQGARHLAGFPLDGSALDAAVAGAVTTLVDGRAFPLFSVLFGYGVVQLTRRQGEADTPWRAVRRLVRRRSLWMIVIGFLHYVLLYVGDIVAAYGFLALVLVVAVRWKERVLLALAGLVFVALSVPGAADPVGQRSLTCYLAQSVVWTLVFAPYALDLSDDLGVASTAVLAVGTWLATVGIAELMRRRGARGPAEVLLRRLTYR